MDPNSPPCGAKIDCEPLSHLTLRLWVRPVPSSKPFKNVYDEHTAGPWLIQCDEILQKSVDFNRSLLSSLGRGVFVASFWSPTGSSGPCVCLKRWNHQFPYGKTNGSHSALLNIHHRNRQLGPGSGGLLALQIGVKSGHLAAAWAFKIVATAMRAEQVALFWGQSGPTSTCLVNFC